MGRKPGTIALRHFQKIVAATVSLHFAGPTAAETTCYLEGANRVCTTVTQRVDGSVSTTSRSSTGETYSINTEVDTSYDGTTRITSIDSSGHSYGIKSWSDATGSHSIDTEGNKCTLTHSGQWIGC